MKRMRSRSFGRQAAVICHELSNRRNRRFGTKVVPRKLNLSSFADKGARFIFFRSYAINDRHAASRARDPDEELIWR